MSARVTFTSTDEVTIKQVTETSAIPIASIKLKSLASLRTDPVLMIPEQGVLHKEKP
jgi:hypothetical protein